MAYYYYGWRTDDERKPGNGQTYVCGKWHDDGSWRPVLYCVLYVMCGFNVYVYVYVEEYDIALLNAGMTAMAYVYWYYYTFFLYVLYVILQWPLTAMTYYVA